MAEIKIVRLTHVDMCTHLEHSMKIKQQACHGVSSLRVTW